MLALPGPAFPAFDFTATRPAAAGDAARPAGPRFTIAGRAVVLEGERFDDGADVNHMVRTATSLWDCSLVLAKLLEHQPALLAGRILELGMFVLLATPLLLISKTEPTKKLIVFRRGTGAGGHSGGAPGAHRPPRSSDGRAGGSVAPGAKLAAQRRRPGAAGLGSAPGLAEA